MSVTAVNIEYLWLTIFISKIFLFLLGQKVGNTLLLAQAHSCKKSGHRKYCKLCEMTQTFDASWNFYIYITDFLFTMVTVLVILYYVFKLLQWIANMFPISIVYLLSFGQYDPLLKFYAPPWLTPIFYAA